MKIEFLADGSPDCPLIRLYNYDTQQIYRLYALLLDLAVGRVNNISLQKALPAEAVAGCDLVLQAADEDQGIVRDSSQGRFFCRLSCSSWQSVAERVLPFHSESSAETYQWLNETSPISWLLSSNGLW